MGRVSLLDTVRARYQSESTLSPEGEWWEYRQEKRVDKSSGAYVGTKTCFLDDPRARLWIRNETNLTVEANLPKLVFGNNARLLVDPSQAIQFLDGFIHDHVQGVADSVSNYGYSRIDYCHNFDVGRENIPHYIKAFSRLNLFRKKTLHNDEETISWQSRGRMVRAYNKEREMFASKSPGSELAKGLLRVEVEIRRSSQVLNRFLKSIGKASLLLRDALNPDAAYEMLQRHVERLRFDVPITSTTRAFEILRRHFEGPRAVQLYGFYQALNSYGIARVKQMLPQSTYYYFRKQLKDVGLWLACPEAEYLPPLVLPAKRELLALCQN